MIIATALLLCAVCARADSILRWSPDHGDLGADFGLYGWSAGGHGGKACLDATSFKYYDDFLPDMAEFDLIASAQGDSAAYVLAKNQKPSQGYTCLAFSMAPGGLGVSEITSARSASLDTTIAACGPGQQQTYLGNIISRTSPSPSACIDFSADNAQTGFDGSYRVKFSDFWGHACVQNDRIAILNSLTTTHIEFIDREAVDRDGDEFAYDSWFGAAMATTTTNDNSTGPSTEYFCLSLALTRNDELEGRRFFAAPGTGAEGIQSACGAILAGLQDDSVDQTDFTSGFTLEPPSSFASFDACVSGYEYPSSVQFLAGAGALQNFTGPFNVESASGLAACISDEYYTSTLEVSSSEAFAASASSGQLAVVTFHRTWAAGCTAF